MDSIKVLIVDDEPRIRRGVERLVRSCGEEWEVVAALSDGAEALAFMEERGGGVDLLITDIKMPEMDGLTLIREAKKRFGFSPLLLTGYGDFDYMQAALREGAVDYLLKPIDRDGFRERLSEIKERIGHDRLRRLKWGELSRQAGKLKQARRKQTLVYLTSAAAGDDLSRLGFWVDDFPEGFYLLLYISLDALPVKARAYTEQDWKAYHYVLDNIIDELVSGGAQDGGEEPGGEAARPFVTGGSPEGRDGRGGEARFGWSWRGGASDFWALLCRPASASGEELDEAAEGAAEAIRAAVARYTPFTVSVAYGDWFDDLYLLPAARQEALSLIHYRLLHGGNRRFTAETAGLDEGRALEKPAGAEPGAETARQERRLKQAVGQGRKDDALRLSRALFEAIERLQTPNAIQRAVQSAVVLLHSVGLESCGVPCFSVQDALDAVKRAVNLQEMKAEFERLVQASLEQIEAVREQGSAEPVERAKAWVEERLGGDVTIRRIAEQVHMNPNYFCQYFKQQTGETVLDYVTRRRMERAAELLRDPGVKLQEVGERVGYKNPKYFGRLFKRWSGDTPSKYRERRQGEGHSPSGGASS